jgi:hypothetical protein
MNRIFADNATRIRKFTVNTDNRHLIVLDSLNLVHFYSFDGQKLRTEDAEAVFPGGAIMDLAYHNHQLWAITALVSSDDVFGKWMVRLDLSFRPVASARLGAMKLGRFHLDSGFSSELFVTEQNMYVYSPFSFKETLLQDTLFLLSSGQLDKRQLFTYYDEDNIFPAYSIPLLLSKRYLIASCQTHAAENDNYLFCFDRKTYRAFGMNGFKDDFYQTGIVKNLQPLNPDNQEYYFYKSGKDVLAAFPERAEDANPVLFFVRLNG